jgi:hypothetical protein
MGYRRSADSKTNTGSQGSVLGAYQSAGSVAQRRQGTVSRLQRAIGNQNALRFLQTKLAINQPGDRYEQAADRMADAVVQSEGGSTPCACESSGTPCTECASKKLQRMDANVAHATPSSTKQDAIGADMRQEARGDAGTEAPAVVHEVLTETGRPLDTGTRAFMEPRFGHDFSGVRVHTSALAEESARAVGARAYTVGRDIVFAGGEHAPENPLGRRLLAHELSHVVQQGAASGALHSDGILQRQPAAPAQVTQTPAQADEELEKILRAAARARTKTGVEAMIAATEVVYRMIDKYLPDYAELIAGVGYDPRGAGVVAGPTPKAGEAAKQGRYIEVTPGAGFIARVAGPSNINMMAEELRVALGGTGISPLWDQAKYTEAKTNHAQQQQRAKEILENFRKQPHTTKEEKLLANSLEWIRKDETTTGRFEVTILTPTHYSQNAADGKQMFFDFTVKYPKVAGDYDPRGKDQRGLIEEQRSTTGRADPKRTEYPTGLGPLSPVLIFLQPDEPVTLERLSRTIIHETQHMADRIATVPAPISDIEGVKRLYQTEFHAYWIETRVSWPCEKLTLPGGKVMQNCPLPAPVDTSAPDFGSAKKQAHKSTVKGSEVQQKDECKKLLNCDDLEKKEQPTNFKSERQQKIFEHLVNMYPKDLFDCAYVCNKDFRDMVHGMTGPEGVNLVNSVRIEALLETLEPKAPQIENVKAAAGLLDDTDRAFLKDQAQAKPFWDLLGKKLQTAEVADIKKIISK